jgi:hypothetical protein
MAQADGEGAQTFGQLLPPLGEMVRGWLAEDIPSFDYGGAVVGDKPETMTLYCKSPVRCLHLFLANPLFVTSVAVCVCVCVGVGG